MVSSLSGAGRTPLILDDGGPAARRVSPFDGIAAARPGARALSAVESGFRARDIFREAQIHFNFYGRLMVLRAPGEAGVMHWTYPVPLRIAGWRNLYTVHDAIPLDPSIASPIDPRRHRRMLDRIAEYADRIVTVSEAARADIVARVGCDPAMVVNCSQAVDVSGPATAPLPAPLLPGGYFLFVGTIETRKNLERLIAGHGKSGVDTPLVLVGPRGYGAESVLQSIAANAATLCFPFQERATLLRIMADAKALLFPTLGEGFGLPVAEAMTLGVPVMTSRGGALEEIAGGSALLVDPGDVDGMARAIGSLDRDAGLRERLIAAGIERSVAFASQPYAERLLGVYAEVA
jgi:glycosyltransferase involved in cell wall biosynthesis